MDNRCISLLMGNKETCHLHPPSDEISSATHWRCLSRRCGMRIGFVAVSALRPLLKLMADHATEVNFSSRHFIGSAFENLNFICAKAHTHPKLSFKIETAGVSLRNTTPSPATPDSELSSEILLHI